MRCKRRKQRAGLRTRLPIAPEPDATQFEVLLCLPTAPPLPTAGSGDFGTSPFYGQLSDKPLACLYYLGIPDLKHKSGSRNSALNTPLPAGVLGPSDRRTADEAVKKRSFAGCLAWVSKKNSF